MTENKTLIVFIDLSKAFDTLDHLILTEKLEKWDLKEVYWNCLRAT